MHREKVSKPTRRISIKGAAGLESDEDTAGRVVSVGAEKPGGEMLAPVSSSLGRADDVPERAGAATRKDRAAPAVLRLMLSKEPFKAMVTGEKAEEYRDVSDWMKARLYDKETGHPRTYDLVEFKNGRVP